MSLNYSIKQAIARRRRLQWQIAGEKIGEVLQALIPVGWMLFGATILWIAKAR